jgi:glycosyltransferase involved in cell wall biosynthesis
MMIKRTEPAEQAYWRDVVAPRLGSDVTVLDEPSHTVKVDLLGRARAMLFPIDWLEPFGLVMIESMACGTPVIASSLGAAPEVIADGTTGFLCSTVGQMVNAVGRAKDLKAQDCRDRVVRQFSSEAMVAGYERVYLNALERETVRDIASWVLPERTRLEARLAGLLT